MHPEPPDATNEKALAVGRRYYHERLREAVAPGRFLFVSISGAHIYGFPSADSDLDLRGTYLLPLQEAIRLEPPPSTFEAGTETFEGVEIDCVGHDLKKYLSLLSRKNGYVLEQIFSPLVVHDDGNLAELRSLARGAMSRNVVHHYKGFFRSQEKLVLKSETPTAKAILYLFRVVMTGLHLLRTGEVETNLLRLNQEDHGLPFIDELVGRKLGGKEKDLVLPGERDFFLGEARRLEAELDAAAASSPLPDSVRNIAQLDEFLVRLRLGEGGSRAPSR